MPANADQRISGSMVRGWYGASFVAILGSYHIGDSNDTGDGTDWVM
jgi:hypothetical protein